MYTYCGIRKRVYLAETRDEIVRERRKLKETPLAIARSFPRTGGEKGMLNVFREKLRKIISKNYHENGFVVTHGDPTKQQCRLVLSA